MVAGEFFFPVTGYVRLTGQTCIGAPGGCVAHWVKAARNVVDTSFKPSSIAQAIMSNIFKVFRFGWPYLQKYWGRLLAGFLLGILFALTNAACIWATKTLIDRIEPPKSAVEQVQTRLVKPAQKGFFADVKVDIERKTQQWVDSWLPRLGRDLDTLQILGGVLFFPLLIFIRGYVGFLSSYCMGWSSERVVNDLRINVMEKLSSLSLDFFNRSTMGDLITRVNGDTVAIQKCLSIGFSDLVKEPVTILFIVGTLCLLDLQLTLAAMIFLPICILPVFVLGKKARKATKAGLSANISQASLLVEMLSGIRVVKAFGLESHQLDRYRRLSRELVHYAVKGIQARELVNPIIETLSMIGFGGLIVYIIYQRKSIPDVVSFLMGMVVLYGSVKKLAALHVTFEQTSVGFGRLMNILHEQPSVKDPVQPKLLPAFAQAITFENVSFSYGNQMVLNDINLAIARGQKVGLAGESGSGKSTLINLAFRFYDPTKGDIKIDGLDLREVSVAALHQQMALVSQEIVLFDLTIAENIALGKIGATQAEIEMAAKAAYAHDFIMQQPDGYNTRIGERGVNLSGGQRQRLAIARAFVRNAPILILDEATASLDSQSEAEVQAAIDRLSENRTVISVAHRLSTLANMDRIVVLSQGRIVEQGGFKELVRAGGIFTDMARRQGILLDGRI